VPLFVLGCQYNWPEEPDGYMWWEIQQAIPGTLVNTIIKQYKPMNAPFLNSYFNF